MLSATDLKNGTTFAHYEKPYQVIKYSLIKMGRGGAVVKLKAKNLESGAIEEISFSSNAAVDEVNTYKKKLQYLYKSGDSVIFMDPKTFEQAEIPLTVLVDAATFLKEGQEVDVLFWDEKPLSVEIAPSVNLAVVECDPGVKGNSATNIYKPARLENGLRVKVPLFIKVGDRIKVDTKTGQYLERTKKD
jgi:elongation factor P